MRTRNKEAAVMKHDDNQLSRLMLGTVQFGLNYGIANRTGQPSYETVREIIALAIEGGVNCFDTAALYGESEEVLGKAFTELGARDTVTIATKVVAISPDHADMKTVDKIVEESVTTSLKRLRLERLSICLFHKEDNFCFIESLLRLKERGLVDKVGSSVITPEGASKIISSGLADAIQIPSSMLDHRFLRSGLTQQACKNRIHLFVRSIYLQGLLFVDESDILPELSEVIPVLRNLRTLAQQAGMSLAELAVRYVLSLDGVTSVVIGVETLQQMKDNLLLFGKGPLSDDLVRAIDKAVPNLSDQILMPNRWSKRMPDVSGK
jgi:aryl-alcohol dehydrogenase-like predicted oxidoreductase